jgi:hypothetical protein
MTGSVAGIDWASEKHDVLIANEHGERLLAETFAHDEQGITALCDELLCFEVEIVAIERGDGVLVERLLEAGVRGLALHPDQVKAARDRFRASGGKSDRFDCFVLCELARTDAHRFRLLEPNLRSDPGAARADPLAGRSGGRAGRAGQPAPGGAGAVLARADRPVRRFGSQYADRATCSARQIGSTPNRSRCSSTNAISSSLTAGRAPARKKPTPP